MQIVYGREPARNYDAEATKLVVVIASRVHYDEGYRIADEGEEVKVSPADFDSLVKAKQVVEIEAPKK
jgi:hypothetical protein